MTDLAEPSGTMAQEDTVPSLAVDVGAEFRRLRKQWHDETALTSSFTKMILHPAYQMIIGLGPDVVPHILAALKAEPDHWGWALNAITREDPVPEDCEGDVVAIADAWLTWGSERGMVFTDGAVCGGDDHTEPMVQEDA